MDQWKGWMFLPPVFRWACSEIKQTVASLAWIQEAVSWSGEENLSLLYIVWVVLNPAEQLYEDKPFSHFNPQVSFMYSTFSSCSGDLQEQDLVSCTETSAVGSSFACVQISSQLKWAHCLKAHGGDGHVNCWFFFQSSLAIQQATLCMGLTFKQGYNLVALRFLEEQKHVSSSVQNVQSWFYSKKERTWSGSSNLYF